MKEQLEVVIEKLAAIADGNGVVKGKAIELIMDTGMELFTGLIELAMSEDEAPSNNKAWDASLSPEVRDLLTISNLVRTHLTTTSTVYNDARQKEAIDALQQMLSEEIDLPTWVQSVNAIHGDTYDLLVNITGSNKDASKEEKAILADWNNYLTNIPFLLDHRLIETLGPRGLYDYFNSLGLIANNGVQVLPSHFYRVQSTALKDGVSSAAFLMLLSLECGENDPYDKCLKERQDTKIFKAILSPEKDDKPWMSGKTRRELYTEAHAGKLRPVDIQIICDLSDAFRIMVGGYTDKIDWIISDIVDKEEKIDLVILSKIFNYYDLTEDDRVMALNKILEGNYPEALMRPLTKTAAANVTRCTVSCSAPYERGRLHMHKSDDAKTIVTIPFTLKNKTLTMNVPFDQEDIDPRIIGNYVREWGTRFGFGVVVKFLA